MVIFASYVATIYGMLYLLFTTIPTTFRTQYNWSIETTGLVYISFAIGMCLSLIVLMKTIDKRVARLRLLNNGVFEPEMRLGKLIYVTMGVGPSLILYGWSAERQWHWIVPILSLIPFGFGMVGIFLGSQTYIVDSFSQYAASAVAATTCLRSIVGTVLVSPTFRSISCFFYAHCLLT